MLQGLIILSALRQRLLVVRQQLRVHVNEQAAFVSAKLQKQLIRHCQASLKVINADLDQVNRQMDDLIHQEEQLCELFKLITFIPGVGPAVAIEVILATDEFKNFADPKKLAASAVRLSCWCGSFRTSSGGSAEVKVVLVSMLVNTSSFCFTWPLCPLSGLKRGGPCRKVASLLSTQGS